MLGWWKGGKAFTRKRVEVLELIGTLVQVLQNSPKKKKQVTNNPTDISCPNFVNKLKKMKKILKKWYLIL